MSFENFAAITPAHSADIKSPAPPSAERQALKSIPIFHRAVERPPLTGHLAPNKHRSVLLANTTHILKSKKSYKLAYR